MGILNDISSSIKDLRELAKSDEVKSAMSSSRSSLSRKGTEGTLQFPNITSKALSIDHAIMINKALERQYSVFVQITLSLNPYLDLSRDKDVTSYLKRLHQNHKKGFLNTLGDLSLENSMTIISNEDESIEAKFIIAEGTSMTALKDQTNNLYHTMDYVNESCLNDLYTPKTPLMNFKNPNLNTFFNNRICLDGEIVTEAKLDYKKYQEQKRHNQASEDETNRHNLQSEELGEKQYRHKKGQDLKDYNLRVRQFNEQQKQNDQNNKFKERQLDEIEKQNTINNDFRQQDLNMRQKIHDEDLYQKEKEFKYRQERDFELDEIRKHEFNASNMGNTSVRMSDSECKKANELVPTTLAVSLNVKEHGNFGGTINFVLGIKTILHPVTSDEMIRNLVLGCKNSSKFFKFIKWTTGEIKFFKDFILNISDIRTDVLSTMSKKESGWWTSLKRRRQISDLKRRFGQGLMPNAAITLTMDEVQLIRSNYGYDLTDVKLVSKIMRDYFLLSFVIVDPSQELAMFLFDGENHFQTMSFAGLERENNNSKNDFKEIYKLINSGRL